VTTYAIAVVTANDRLKQRFQSMLALSFLCATALHLFVFELWPEMQAEAWAKPGQEVVEILQLRDIVIPQKPADARRPAAPVMSANVTAEETLPVIGFEEYADFPPPPVATATVSGDGGTAFTPFTVAPTLENPVEVQRALERVYPASLRDAGLGGTVSLMVHIDAAGQVLEAQVGDGSGYPPLDQAALGLADIMRFRPAMNRDKRVAVWVRIPLTFRVR